MIFVVIVNLNLSVKGGRFWGAFYKCFTEGGCGLFLGTVFVLEAVASKYGGCNFGFRGHVPKKCPKKLQAV